MHGIDLIETFARGNKLFVGAFINSSTNPFHIIFEKITLLYPFSSLSNLVNEKCNTLYSISYKYIENSPPKKSI